MLRACDSFLSLRHPELVEGTVEVAVDLRATEGETPRSEIAGYRLIDKLGDDGFF
jgi:hypothetical protein